MELRTLRTFIVATPALVAAACSGPGPTGAAGGSASPASGAPADVAGTQAQVLTVEMGEFFFEPSSLSVRPGAVTVNLTNVGERRAHTFIVKTLSGSDDLAGTDEIPLGESATLQFTLTQPGTYEVYCGVGNHAERGQTGTLTVRAA